METIEKEPKTDIPKKRKRKISFTAKERAFIREFCKTGIGYKSAIAAGYKENSAHVTASHLLKKPKISQAIEKFQASLENQALITTEEIIKEIREIAFNRKNSARDRTQALIQLGRYLGIWIDKKEISIENLQALAEKEGIPIAELQAEVEELIEEAKADSARLKIAQ